MVGRRQRFEGTLDTWSDDRGFGFLSLPRGGKTVFAHISKFEALTRRPHTGDVYTFEIVKVAGGKLQARSMRLVRYGDEPDMVSRTGPGPLIPSSSLGGTIVGALVILIFVTEYVILSSLLTLPLWVAGLYLGFSVACFLLYAEDKAKARAGTWRVRESSLQVLALIGGWPGAIVAQRVLHHKTRKAGFQFVFWAAVVLNMAALAALSIILGRG